MTYKDKYLKYKSKYALSTSSNSNTHLNSGIRLNDNFYNFIYFLKEYITKFNNIDYEIQTIFSLICIYGGIEDINLISHFLMLFLIDRYTDKINYNLYFNCEKKFINLDKHTISLLIVKRMINIIIFINDPQSQFNTADYIKPYLPYLNSLSIFQSESVDIIQIFVSLVKFYSEESDKINIDNNRLNKSCHNIYTLYDNTSIFTSPMLDNIIPNTMSFRCFFNSHPNYKFLLPGNNHIFGGRLPTYMIDNYDILYFCNMLEFLNNKISNFYYNDDDTIIDIIILLIKYKNQSHNMFVNWEEFFGSVDAKFREKSINNVHDKNDMTNTISNLRSCLSTFSDCREHSYILCIVYTLYQLLKFESLINKDDILLIDFNIIENILSKHIRIGINKVFINTNITGDLLRKRVRGKVNIIIPLEYSVDDTEFDTRNRSKNDTIILNSQIFKDPYGIIRKNKNCNTYNCIQLINEGDHVVCYLYSYNTNNTSIIIKDCLYANLYGEMLPNKYKYWFNSHNIIINEIQSVNNNNRILYLINSLSGGIFVFYELQDFSCTTINIYSISSLISKNIILENDIEKPLWFKELFKLFHDPRARLNYFNIQCQSLIDIIKSNINDIVESSKTKYDITYDEMNYLFLNFDEMYNFYLNMYK